MARYLPAEDTRLLVEALKPYSGGTCLEIGFGNGTVVASLSERFSLAVGTDVLGLDEARLARRQNSELVLSDRASCFRDRSFELVCFNPPYLPSKGIEDRAVDGGREGVEVPLAFLEEGLRVLKDGGLILALLSDSGDVEGFVKRAQEAGLDVQEVARKGVFYENLVVFKMEKSSGRAKTLRRSAKTVERR